MTDEFITETYGDLDFQTAEEVAVQVAEAVDFMEWELAAAATDAHESGFAAATKPQPGRTKTYDNGATSRECTGEVPVIVEFTAGDGYNDTTDVSTMVRAAAEYGDDNGYTQVHLSTHWSDDLGFYVTGVFF